MFLWNVKRFLDSSLKKLKENIYKYGSRNLSKNQQDLIVLMLLINKEKLKLPKMLILQGIIPCYFNLVPKSDLYLLVFKKYENVCNILTKIFNYLQRYWIKRLQEIMTVLKTVK